MIKLLVLLLALTLPTFGHAQTTKFGFKHVVVIVLENRNYSTAIANPILGAFAKSGALLSDYFAIGHPTGPNYLALTAGTNFGITNDGRHLINTTHLGDLFEAKGLTWKNYAVGYPGNCYYGGTVYPWTYVFTPFLSYADVRTNLARCDAHVVNANELTEDVANDALPNYALFSPGFDDSGHSTGLAAAAAWVHDGVLPLLQDPKFITNTLVVLTFDEGATVAPNHVYTALYGSVVVPGTVSNKRYDHYSLVRTIEDNFGLGTMGKHDATAVPITGVWKTVP